MNIPKVLSKTTLRPITSPDETHAVRVVLHEAHNSGPFRLQCQQRTYVFEKNGTVGKHVLDIPVSIWMDGVGQTRFAANKSVCDDFRTAKNAPYTFQVIPLKESQAVIERKPSEADAALPLLREILSNLGAPQIVIDAFHCIDAGDMPKLAHIVELSRLIEENPPPSAKPWKADSLQKARDAKAAKKKAQLQHA